MRATPIYKILLYGLLVFGSALRISRYWLGAGTEVSPLYTYGYTIAAVAAVCMTIYFISAALWGLPGPLIRLVIGGAYLFFMPFEFAVSWVAFRFNGSTRRQILQELNAGKFDSIISQQTNPLTGAWVTIDGQDVKLYRDSSKQLVFLPRGQMGLRFNEVFGLLYATDGSAQPLLGPTEKTSLGDGWYWVRTWPEPGAAP